MPIDLAALLPSWKLALRADRKSPQTLDAYTTGVRLFLQWPRSQVAIIDGRACSVRETELLQELLFAADDARLEMELSKRELEFMEKATGKLLSGLNAPSILWFPLSGANSERDDF